DSFGKTSKIANKAKDKCFMAHGSSRGFLSSDESEGLHSLEKSRKSQKSGVIAYKRSIKIQVQKIKKNTSSGHVSTARKFPVDR
ncbi:hypothetical protein Taro_006920, partial [Colocasia esculenta]|nr:hypothetical protein [Colocasia esculenta]